MNKTFMIIGGDNRLGALAQMLIADGKIVYSFGLDKYPHNIGKINTLISCDICLLPMPLMKNGFNAPLSTNDINLYDILDTINPTTTIFAGGVPDDIYKRYPNLKIIDYLKRPELAILNAIPTAEGAIALAFENMDIILHGCKCLVIGNGRIGKILSNKLSAIGADVTVSARSETDFADIYSKGFKSIHTLNLKDKLSEFDLIINTIPVMVLSREELALVQVDTLIIDLASKPGGTDFIYANELGIKTIHALSLPGKVAPNTSAKFIKDTIYNIIREEGL